MTKRERAQVVELLRCAADNLTPTSTGAWTDALDGLDVSIGIEFAASRAFGEAASSHGHQLGGVVDCEDGRAVYLEAAARVEEGSYP